jgi:hypothetical protein
VAVLCAQVLVMLESYLNPKLCETLSLCPPSVWEMLSEWFAALEASVFRNIHAL